MPGSSKENKSWMIDKIKEIRPKTVLDVGAGNGNIADLIKDTFSDSIEIDGLEVWAPYIEDFNLRSKYRNVFNADARSFDSWNYDLVIFGDVLEHMKEQEARDLWAKASKYAKNIIITIPIIHYPQGEHFGNPYEIHQEEDWNTKRVLNAFPGIVNYKQFRVTGAYLAKFVKNES